MPQTSIPIISANPESEAVQSLARSLDLQGIPVNVVALADAAGHALSRLQPGIVDARALDDAAFERLLDYLQRNPALWVAITDADGRKLSAARRRALFERTWASIDPQTETEQIVGLIRAAIRHQSLSGREADAAVGGFDEIVGSSPAMLKLFDRLKRFAKADAPVLVTGESGTGKELVASALHTHSARKRGPFVALNCAAIPAELIGSELFGHEQGAFTDATSTRIGRIEQAQGGTLFLDEIGDLPLEAQTYLLRALQEGVIERLGSTVPITVDVRIVAATHVDLNRAVQEGRFRLDLLHRLKVLELAMPRLRDRGEDVRALAEHFLERFRTETSRTLRGFSAEAMDAMLMHDWPGNVREMANRIRQACVMGEGRWISAADLKLSAQVSGPLLPLDQIRDQAEVAAIRNAFLATERSMSRTAQALGISRMTLYRLIQKHQQHLRDVMGDDVAEPRATPATAAAALAA